MAETKQNTEARKEMSVEEKLRALYNLQKVDTEIHQIRTLRGELPLEVQDLEDEIAGLQTRIQKFQEEIEFFQNKIVEKSNEIAEAEAKIKKYGEKQMQVRNNREYDSITKEIEFQNLEIQLANKKIGEFKEELTKKKEETKLFQDVLNDKDADLKHKNQELDQIVGETQKDEETLIEKAKEISLQIEPRLVTAYNRIRKSVRNRLSVVSIEREACGGCFNKIPPQRQLDIASRRKIIVCEHCGRILVDADIDKEI